MKKFIYLFAPLLALAFSCSDDRDQLPLSFLDGTYELATQNTDTGLWYVNQLIFTTNGTLTAQTLVRDSADGENLGWYSYATGTYELRGEEYTVDIASFYRLEFESEEPYVQQGDLVLEEEYSPEPGTGRLRQLENGQKIAIVFPCNDTPGAEISSNCLGEQEYQRID